jgi:hypothetical protein
VDHEILPEARMLLGLPQRVPATQWVPVQE